MNLYDTHDTPILPAHLCFECKRVTFNDPNAAGAILCNRCLKIRETDDDL